LVVVVLQPVQMHREEQIRRGLEQIELLLEQQRVGAERDELLARDEAAHDLADLLVDQRLAAGDRHHRRTAFVGCVPALLGRHTAIEDGIRIVDLAAADTGEIATEQRFQHQHQRIALAAQQLLLEQIAADPQFLEEGYGHYVLSFWSPKNCYSDCSEFRRQSELDILFPARQHRNRHRSDPPERLDDVIHQNLRRRGTSSDPYGPGLLQPVRIELAAISDEIARDPGLGADFAEPIGVGTIGGAHHQYNVYQLAQVPYRGLTILCRIADISGVRALNICKTRVKSRN